MNLRAKAVVLLAVIGAASGLSPAPGQEKFKLKEGAKGKICLTCHDAFQETLKLPFVHTPVKSGDCSACHNPHASTHGKLLSTDPSRICLECHGGLVAKDARSVHRPVAEGACNKCHDPHASKNRNNLLAAGNELCNGCHKDIAAAVQGARFKHSPVESGCLGCHDPHAGAKSPSLLRKDVPALCVGCHKPDQPAFVKQHMGYPVAKARCTSCHDPHGSSNKGILWASVHPPVANKMCGQCHPDPSSPNALETKKTGIDLCRGCHSGMINDTFARSRIHWPVVDKTACLHCHTPHAAKTAKLLAKPMKELCGGCHSDTIARQVRSLTKHPPVEEGDCATCHTPHSSGGPFLLATPNVVDLCGTCHDWQRHSTHPIGEKAVDKRNRNLTLDCLTCHRTHGSPYKHFAHFDTKAELCVQCHEEFRR